jgi:hypothetical protein
MEGNRYIRIRVNFDGNTIQEKEFDIDEFEDRGTYDVDIVTQQPQIKEREVLEMATETRVKYITYKPLKPSFRDIWTGKPFSSLMEQLTHKDMINQGWAIDRVQCVARDIADNPNWEKMPLPIDANLFCNWEITYKKTYTVET